MKRCRICELTLPRKRRPHVPRSLCVKCYKSLAVQEQLEKMNKPDDGMTVLISGEVYTICFNQSLRLNFAQHSFNK